MNNTQEQYQEEIDLRKLLSTLWENKFLILATTVIFAISGIVYALLAPQVWSSKAVVCAPFSSQVSQLRLRLENLKIVNASPARADDFFAAFSETKLFSDFIQSFNSFDNKIKFLKENGYVPQEVRNKSEEQQRFLEKAAEKITANQKKNETFYTLSFSAENAQEARNRLSGYINFLQAEENLMKSQQLNVEIGNQTQTLEHYYQVRKADTIKWLQEDITRTEFALRISKTAGIEVPVENLNNQTLFPIDLGAKALNEKLKILKEIKEPELINPALVDIRLRLNGIQALPQEKVSFASFHFLKSPSEPLGRDKPKRPLVVILATLAGLMLGMLISLFRSYSLH